VALNCEAIYGVPQKNAGGPSFIIIFYLLICFLLDFFNDIFY